MKKLFIAAFACSFFLSYSFAQAPAGYYDDAYGKTGEDLRTALHNIIKGHSVKNYDDLWNYFPSTDKKSNGQVWDIYSDNPSGTPPYTFSYSVSADQCGNYSNEGDCFNREHSTPKSWFNDASPMYSDLFQIYPTDGYVNNKRGNYPYGEVNSASWTSDNGSKIGNSVVLGYSGVVFEPIDEYKGDIARTFFYMITRYQNVVSGWNGEMYQGNTLSGWAMKMLYDWDRNDPVSQKEIDRNNAIYNIQGNRNPFIDLNYFVFDIWDTQVGVGEIEGLNVIFRSNGFNLPEYGVVEMYDLSGRLIFNEANVNEVNYKAFVNGVYLTKITIKEKQLTHKIIICN